MERRPLRLKGSRGALGAGKQKNKRVKDTAQILELIMSSKKQQREEEKRGLDKRTPAQAAFEKMQEKQMELVLKKASKSHKQQVGEFNRYLDTLSITTFPKSAALND